MPIAKDAGARIVIMNAQPTQFDEIADAVLNGAIGDALPLICGASSLSDLTGVRPTNS